MPDANAEKAAAAAYAVTLVEDGMRVGLGTGSTAAYAVAMLGERVRKGLRIVGIPTSERTRVQAEKEGIPIVGFDTGTTLDLTIDGADEADRKLRLVKGGGGALLREKVVASISRRVVIIADSAKLVDRLGKFPLPVEAVRFAWQVVEARLAALGAKPKLRAGADGAPFLTDEGHYILDAHFGEIADPERLSRQLLDTPGVVDHGLFLGIANDLVIGRGGSVEVLRGAAS
jgi:ribose 5-phosphate isomerase A